MNVALGLIEGFFGTPWSWPARRAVVTTLAPHGYRSYLYAPKGDPFLRRRWQGLHPADWARELFAFREHCATTGVRFGVGLSPFELHAGFDAAARKVLADKLSSLNDWGADEVAILFDDMRGDVPDLAQRQAEIVHWVAARSNAKRVSMCPSYYSDDVVLDRVFGCRPKHYLSDLGAALDSTIDVFWTGQEVCSREISVGHVQRVAAQLRRKPLLWDNYPVNDGPRMSAHLHVRGFTGRPASLAPHIAGHGINVALQPMLTCVSALTLTDSYRPGEGYEYATATKAAAALVLGDELGSLLVEFLLALQDTGLTRLPSALHRELAQRFGAFDHEGAREVVQWLEGHYAVTGEVVRTQ